MSFREISIAVRAENRASGVFRTIGGDLVALGHSFGLLDSSMGRAASAFMSTMHLLVSLKGALTATTAVQNAYTAATVSATGATHGLNVALSALGGPIGLILGLATAMGALAYATNQAAEAERRHQEELKKARGAGYGLRSYYHASEQELFRQGVEQP